ncbi:hypothetical protein F5X99DRAFT_421355 [Biscogniauxia marginata]|nr:hypothetical protein F5X99DRAFT_421355 [Biscogniauxia marginata]
MVTTRAASLLNTPMQQDTVDSTILDVDDSDDDVLARNTGKSNTSTLESFKTKLIRRISQRSDTKRYSQKSLGNSDEEVARRAELKRLMRKRIQEELKSEEQDSRTKSTCLDDPIYDNCLEPDLPGGGPRDTIEFTVSGVEQKEPGDIDHHSTSAMPRAFLADKDQEKDLQRRRSCPESAYIPWENSVLDSSLPTRGPGSLPHLSSSPILSPVHLPGTQESDSTRSWSLSYSASHLASYLGPAEETRQSLFSQDHEVTHQEREYEQTRGNEDRQSQETDGHSLAGKTTEGIVANLDKTHETQPTQTSDGQIKDTCDDDSHEGSGASFHDTTADRYSPLDMWLRSQELQSTSEISSCRTSEMALDKISDSTSQVALHIVSHPPETTSSSIPSQKLPPGAWPQSRNSEDSAGPGLPRTPSNESLALKKVVAQVNSALCPNLLPPEHVQQEPSSRYTSSRYTTRANSRQLTPKESRLSLAEVFGGRKVVSPFLPFHRLATPSFPKDTEKSDSSSYQTAPNQASSPDLGAIQAPPPKRLMADTISREAELRSIEKRFGLVSLHQAPGFPKSARNRHSLLVRFHLPVPKKNDIQTRQRHKNIEDTAHNSRHTRIRDAEHQHEFHGSFAGNRPPMSSNRAIKSEADNRRAEHGGGRSKLQMFFPNTHTIRKASDLAQEQDARNSGACVTDGKVLEDPLRSNPRSQESPHNDRKQSDNTSDGLLREWVNQLDAADPQFQSGSFTNRQNHKPHRLLTPPASWAKWPSHSRLERTGTADAKDNVIPRDFAGIKLAKSGGVTQLVEKVSVPTKKRSLTPISRTLSSQFSKAMKDRWNKIVPGKESSSCDTASSTLILDSRKAHRYLEYPELELLPTPSRYKEVQALEQQIDYMKHRSISSLGKRRESSHDSAKLSLTVRLAEEVHKLQHGDESPPSSDMGTLPVTSTVRLPLTQSRVLPAPCTVSNATEEYGTPQSHISYEDCVPTHMLEEDDDNSRTGDTVNATKCLDSGN